MRKVELRVMELNKYEVIKKLIDTNGNKKSAMLKLGCSLRNINRLIAKYKSQGKKGFIHGNRDRKPANTTNEDLKRKIINLYSAKYRDANIKHFCELIKEYENISISTTTIHRWLHELNLFSPKATRVTKSKINKRIKNLKKQNLSKTEIQSINESSQSLDISLAHPRRPRAKYSGELIQMDASSFKWFGGVITHLHLAIDDATGIIVGAFFDKQETLFAYYNVFKQILSNYGIPAKFLTDRRTVFEYVKLNPKSDEKDTKTQFSYACDTLGVAIETTSVPQGKGRVERLNQTLQSRLPVVLRIANINTIEEANIFLRSYIKKYNDANSIQLDDSRNAYEKQLNNDDINKVLAVLSKRVIDAGHSIKYMNCYYELKNSIGNSVYFHKGTKALVIRCLDNSLFVNVNDNIYALQKIPSHYENSKELDFVEEPKIKKIYIPPITHPWKQQSFDKHLEKQKHRENRC